ncbi:MAG: hypothetical protein NTX45_15280 [Proteobacteria bacterium]|nr:hypothetical protein [Pseudomonadota bacterium]
MTDKPLIDGGIQATEPAPTGAATPSSQGKVSRQKDGLAKQRVNKAIKDRIEQAAKPPPTGAASPPSQGKVSRTKKAATGEKSNKTKGMQQDKSESTENSSHTCARNQTLPDSPLPQTLKIKEILTMQDSTKTLPRTLPITIQIIWRG